MNQRMGRRRPPVDGSRAAPVYLRSGALRTSSAVSSAKDQEPWDCIGMPEKKPNAVPLKWMIDRSVVPQLVLRHIMDHGKLPLECCIMLAGDEAEQILGNVLSEALLQSDIDVFPRRLSMLITREGKVMQMKDAGVRPTSEAAILDVSSVQAAILFGRDRATVDIPLDHPSCSAQHAVIANRIVFMSEYAAEFVGGASSGIREGVLDESVSDLFDVVVSIKDLGSTHGTTLNGERLPPHIWRTLKPLDKVVFGLSSREYVVAESSGLS